MKNLTSKTRIPIAIGLLALLSAMSAYAQIGQMRASVPFQFLAGDKVLPAGEYRVEVNPLSGRMVLRLVDGSAGLYLSANPCDRPASAPAGGMLVFQKYGNHYFLRTLWNPGQSKGYELPRSKSERELAEKTGASEIASVRAW